MRVVLPEPQSPKIPTANRGGLSRMIWASAEAVASNPSEGFFDGESMRIFTPSAVGAESAASASRLMAALAEVASAEPSMIVAGVVMGTFRRKLPLQPPHTNKAGW